MPPQGGSPAFLPVLKEQPTLKGNAQGQLTGQGPVVP